MSQDNSKLAINGGTPVRPDRILIHKPVIDEADCNSVLEALRTTFVSGDGPACREFEKRLAEYLGMKHVLLVNSCTAALDVAYMVKEFPAGAEVIVPDFTYTSTALGPALNGLKVVLVDVEAATGNIDPARVEAAITPNTVAISPVDYAGNSARMDEINAIAEKHGLFVVHDTAQSIGTTYKGRKAGTLADVSCFSFHGTKNITTGEGGAFVTNSDELAQKVIVAREKGTDKHAYLSNPEKTGFYEYMTKGHSFVQSNILAALGLTQLDKLEQITARRAAIAEAYIEAFGGLDGIVLPGITEDCRTNWHVFYIRVPAEHKAWVIEALRAEGVTANIHYHPLHLNGYYRRICEFREDELRNATAFYGSLVRLPIYPLLTDGEVNSIIEAVRKVIASL